MVLHRTFTPLTPVDIATGGVRSQETSGQAREREMPLVIQVGGGSAGKIFLSFRREENTTQKVWLDFDKNNVQKTEWSALWNPV